jgi:hypothetical protein
MFFLLRENFISIQEVLRTAVALLLFFSRKEACLQTRSPRFGRQAKESLSDAGLPKFSRKNRAKTKPRSHTSPPLLRGFLTHKPARIFPAEFLTANPLRMALSFSPCY